MGTGRTMEFDGFIAWGKPEGAGVCLTRPFDGQPASVGNGVMVALAATDQAQVQRLHDIALANGGSREGAPGLRGGGCSAARSAERCVGTACGRKCCIQLYTD